MKKIIVLIAVILLSTFGILSLLGPSYFTMHDDTQIGRVVSMARSLSDGQFPVRWVSDLGYGYGYPIFNFYGPLPYYIGGVLTNLGIPAMFATKIMMGLGMILAPLLAFLVLEQFLGVLAASVSAILFMYAPYHAVQLYVRGAVGELYATAFLPLLFYGIVAPLLSKVKPRTVLVGSLGIALTILSHTISGYASVVFYVLWILIYAGVSKFQKKNVSVVLSMYLLELGIGLLLSAFFWLPALFEMGYTNVAAQAGGSADFRSHFVCISQFINSPWGFGGSTSGCIDGMSFKLGTIHLALFLYAMFLFFVHRFTLSNTRRILLAGFIMLFLSVFFMLPMSAVVWEYIPGFSYIQYPWRFLSIASFALSVVAGTVFTQSRSLMRRIFAVSVIILVLFVNQQEFRPQQKTYRPIDDYESVNELKVRVSKISDEYLPYDFIRPKSSTLGNDSIFESEDLIKIVSIVQKSNYLKAIIVSSSAQPVRILKAWFPGWHYSVNGREVKATIVEGFPIIQVLEGESVVELRLSDTPLRRTANILSFLTSVFCIVFYIRYEKNNA